MYPGHSVCAALCYNFTGTSNGSLAACPVFHPSLTCNAAVIVQSPHDQMYMHDIYTYIYTQPVPLIIYDQLVFQFEKDALDY